jgi:hypothetical protein
MREGFFIEGSAMLEKIQQLYTRRNSNRVFPYDYSAPGYYFVTVCAHNKENLFGDIRRGTIYCAPT